MSLLTALLLFLHAPLSASRGRLSHHRSSLLRDSRGVAALEFALMLPVLLGLSLGAYELSRFMLIHQKVEKTAYTTADVTSQYTSLTTAQMNQIFTAGSQIMQPFAFGANGIIIITSVSQTGNFSANNPPRVAWRTSGGGTLSRNSVIGSVGGPAALPGGLTLNDRDNVIVAEVYYSYTPMLSGTVLSSTDVYKVAVFKPRLGALSTPPS